MSETTPTATASEEGKAPPAIRFLIAAMLFLSYMLFAVAWNWGDLYVRSLGFTASRTAPVFTSYAKSVVGPLRSERK